MNDIISECIDKSNGKKFDGCFYDDVLFESESDLVYLLVIYIWKLCRR